MREFPDGALAPCAMSLFSLVGRIGFFSGSIIAQEEKISDAANKIKTLASDERFESFMVMIIGVLKPIIVRSQVLFTSIHKTIVLFCFILLPFFSVSHFFTEGA
jgi:hypothetical protein